MLNSGGKLPLARAYKYATTLLNTLEYVHTKFNIGHHDIRPSNVIIDEESDLPVLIDWGCAVPIPATESLISGTIQYTSSHILKSQKRPSWKFTALDDIESLAYTIVYMIEGFLPWYKKDIIEGILGERKELLKQTAKHSIFLNAVVAANAKPAPVFSYQHFREMLTCE